MPSHERKKKQEPFDSCSSNIPNSMRPTTTDYTDGFFTDACSATECTGLIPSLPSSEAEQEAYEDLYYHLLRKPAPRDS